MEYEVKTMQKDEAGLPTATGQPVGQKPAEPQKEKPRHFRMVVSVISIILLLILGGGFYYWWTYWRAPSQEANIKQPVSLIEVDETKTIPIKQGQEGELVKELKERAKISQFENPALGSFQRILVRKKDQGSEYFISLGELIEIMEVNISSDVADRLGDDYTLFFYSDAEKLRLGLVAKINETEGFSESLSSWKKAAKIIFKPFLLGEEVQFAGTEEFQTATYQGVEIHYLNFANTSLALDYAIVKDYLVITTSKDSMLKVVDRILK